VRVNVSDMAALMADADLAIGAVGTSALERIALGLPSICVPIAQNQIAYANYIHQKKLGYSIFSQSDIKTASFHHAMRFAERCVPSIEESRASLIGEKTKSIYQTMREIYAF
jgi:spore coat polysaccharide biosynthesis predicted glycosyltransferase SpsG